MKKKRFIGNVVVVLTEKERGLFDGSICVYGDMLYSFTDLKLGGLAKCQDAVDRFDLAASHALDFASFDESLSPEKRKTIEVESSCGYGEKGFLVRRSLKGQERETT